MSATLTQEFIDGAKKTQEKYGIPASVTLAQIILESSGSYPGGLSGLAYLHKNLFGIKKGSWTGKTVDMVTTDWLAGKGYFQRSQTFRKYDSYEESIEDHAKVLLQPIYTNKTKNATTLDEYIDAFAPIYASPSYASTLKDIIKKNNLTKYDNGKYSVDGLTGDSAETTETGLKESAMGVLGNIIQFISIAFLVVLAVVFFVNAFGIVGGDS